MPWVLFALLGGAGALYYESNKKPSFARYQFDFGAADTPATYELLQAAVTSATPGGTVVNQGGGKYLITVPYQFDLFHNIPSSLIPASGTALPSISGELDLISGDFDNLYGGRNKEYNLQVNDDRFAGGPQMPRNQGANFEISGHRWDGQTLT